jgi:hypothetical protein
LIGIQPYMPSERLEIIQADALEWSEHNTRSFDFAWHDLWVDTNSAGEHLDMLHARVITNCLKTVRAQGAWSMDRSARQLMQSYGLRWVG